MLKYLRKSSKNIMLNFIKYTLLIQYDHYVKIYNRLSAIMKNHKRNRSLLQQRPSTHLHKHHQRSLSLQRHQSRQTHYGPLGHQQLLSQSITLPLSTQMCRQGYNKKNKRYGNVGEMKKGNKSKERDNGSGKKKDKSKTNQEKNYSGRSSFDRKGKIGQTADHSKNKNSRQLQSKKTSTDKPQSKSNERKRNKVINQVNIKKTSPENTSKAIRDSNKHIKEQDLGMNCQQVLDQYGHYLSSSQAKQIIEYKRIYFLGSITHRKTSKLLSLAKTLPKTRANPTSSQKRQPINPISQKRQDNNHLPQQQPHHPQQSPTSQNDFYKYQIGDHIAYRYQIIQSINQGSFGQVLKVFDHKNKQFMALKIVKKNQEFVQQTFVQISILTQIKERDREGVSGVVKIKDFTIFRNHICIVFELLNGNLYELLSANNYNGLSQDAIRIFAVQLLNSLTYLQRQKVIHCDLKPQNVMMKNWGKSGVKLIDFGTSCYQGKQMYEYLQSRYYRAPQVILRRPYSFPIDMWSLGCLIVELRLGQPIFAGATNIQQLLYMINSIGWPDPAQGQQSQKFLQSQDFIQLRNLNLFQDYFKLLKNPQKLKTHPFFSQCKYLQTCMIPFQQKIRRSKNYNHDQSQYFIDFLNNILRWQPKRRLKPHQALQHPWIVRGLPSQIKDFYTIFNSNQLPKKKSKSKSSKHNSKNKSNPKKSNQKGKNKQDYRNKQGTLSNHRQNLNRAKVVQENSNQYEMRIQGQNKSKTITARNNIFYSQH